MRVLIIRHGDPDYSIDGLTEKGKREAQLLSLRLQNEGISTIYCSPLGRAQLTAKPTAEKIGVEIITCDWLREFEARLEGIKGAPWNLPPRVWTADERAMDVSRWRDADLWKDTSVVAYYDMICAEFDKLLASHGYIREGLVYRFDEDLKENDETIAIFCHHGLGTALLAHLTGVPLPHMWHTVFLTPSSVTTALMEIHEPEVNTAIARLVSVSDTSHLYAGNEPISSSGLFTPIKR